MQEFLLLLIQIPVLPWSCIVHRNWAIFVESQGGYPTNFCRGFQTSVHTVEKTIEIHENHLAHINSHSYVTFTSPYRWLGTKKFKKKTGGQHETGMLGKGWDVPSRDQVQLNQSTRWFLSLLGSARTSRGTLTCQEVVDFLQEKTAKVHLFLTFPWSPELPEVIKMSTFQMTESRDSWCS